jgi:radical SAM family RiPP maturation amino acid epimerase
MIDRRATINTIWNSRTEADLKVLAQIKRFMECLTGDPEFRARLAQDFEHASDIARDRGIEIDATQLMPLYHREFMQFRGEKAAPAWPLVHKWDTYLAEILQQREVLRDVGSTASLNPRFDIWRNRQIARVQSELGERSAAIVHPIVCYELSRGCTVGCWFCGISAGKFGGYWPFTSENEQKWREMLQVMIARFGAAAQTGFCYWATDPADNPDYIAFIRAHGEITGVVPQTTTAAALRNIERTREILKLFAEKRQVLNRFSILSVGQLRRVHATFSADELLGVELVMQQKGGISGKALAGRALQRRQNDASPSAAWSESAGTIACVSGFLVNAMEGRVKLISPTSACARWPDGYRVYGEATFQTPAEFATAIDGLVEQHMEPKLDGRRRLAFRKDLEFNVEPGGFVLKNGCATVRCDGSQELLAVGAVIRNSDKTVSQAVTELAARGTSPFWTIKCLEDLHRSGLLDDDPLSEILLGDNSPNSEQASAIA